MAEAPTEVQKFPSVEGFTIIQVLSEKGGMADVYLANQHGNDRLVILKCLRENDPNYIKRFRKEAKSHSKIDHPNVVTIYTVQEANGRLFIAMEFMQGGDLGDMIKKGMSDDIIISTLSGVASALKATHELGIIHRDIKPENILFKSDGTAKLSDFGIARTIEGDGLTQANTCIGTPRYMSPEQLKGQEIDGRSDLYSLGLALYEMLTEKLVFEGESMESIFFQKVNQPQLILTKAKRHWQPILDKLIAPDPKNRYQRADDLINDLKNVGQLSTPTHEKSNQRNLLISIVATVIVSSALIGYLTLTNYPSTQDSIMASQSNTNIDPLGAPETNIKKTLLSITSKIQVPYDQENCKLNAREEIDFVPYLGEDLHENNCFGLTVMWNGIGTYYLISDVTGEGSWARMYPNECGSLGISETLPVDQKVHFPMQNQNPWFFKLDNNARSFKFVSLVIEENETEQGLKNTLASIPSICDMSVAATAEAFDWKLLQEKIDSSKIKSNIVFTDMTINHKATTL